MIIGVDFDNTIVAYNALFHRLACEREAIPADIPRNKTAVRDHLRAAGREALWTELQGIAYGPRMQDAEAYPGVHEFFLVCRHYGISVKIISHKTRHPYVGEKHDLHAAAEGWLRKQGFFDQGGIGLSRSDVFFELTKAEKLARIASCGCTHFVDDLPEILTDAAFPTGTRKYLFDPQRAHPSSLPVSSQSSWTGVQRHLIDEESWVGAARRIVAQAGFPAAGPMTALTGGANNRAYRLGAHALVKRYFSHPNDRRDRYGAEKSFYQFTGATGIPDVPKALGWDSDHRLGVFEFVEGEPPRTPGPAQVDAAITFVRRLNASRARPEALALGDASEACFSVEEHLATVRRRLAHLDNLPLEDDLDHEARGFVGTTLRPSWVAVQKSLVALSDSSRPLSREERCLSPSDFGFHNSLVAGERIVFIDFEYAGWDDPAKLVCDFFCQPEIPAPSQEFERFARAVAAALATEPAPFLARCRALLPVYQVKWCCILLNEFTRAGRDRRTFSLGAEPAKARRARQLARARQLVGALSLAA